MVANKERQNDDAKPRICVVRHAYYPQDVRVRKEVHALLEAGYDVDIICLRSAGQKERENVEGAQVFRLGTEHQRESLFLYIIEYAIGFIKMFFLVTSLHFKKRYKCIQVNTLPDALVFVTIITRLMGAKVLLDMHEPAPELFAAKFGPNKFSWAVKWIAFIEQISLKYAHAALAVNDTILQRYIERGADGKKLYVVRNVPEKDVEAAYSSPKADGKFRLLLHGLIVERYGHEMTVRAIAKIRDLIPSIHLTIAGIGENEQRVRDTAKELNCQDIITFTGWVTPAQILELIASTDVGLVPLLPSDFADLCQPNKLFELVSGKRAVIASRLKAIEESFDDSALKFFEPGNIEDLSSAILELYRHPEKRKLLAENAHKQYEDIKWAHNKNVYLEVINKLISSS
jgi:glycosyltransferase involved in cell wall biosynthesis